MKKILKKLIAKLEKFEERHSKIEKFVISFTPRWFIFLGWLFFTGALLYLYQKYDSRIIGLLFFISFLLLALFLLYSLDQNKSYRFFLEKYIRNIFIRLLIDITFITVFSFFMYIFLVVTISRLGLK